MMRGYNSTIIRKQKNCVSCGKSCYPFSKGRCQPCATIEDTGKRFDKMSQKVIEEDNLQDLIADADKIVSLYVRLKDADKDGMVACFTCPAILHYKEMQCGHYIRRGHLFLRWDVSRNLRNQCPSCNCGKHGNLARFAQNLEKENPGLPDILMEESLLVYKPTREEIKNIISEYTPKVSQLLKLHTH